MPYITRASVFQRVRDGFLGQIQRDLLREAEKLCGLFLGDDNIGRAKSIKRFQKRFSHRQVIDFTSAFFALGNSYLDMALVADVEVNCITRAVAITGNIRYEIND